LVSVKVAVAGLGVIAQTTHLPLLERLRKHFDLVAVCDLSATLTARVGERYDVARRYTNVTEMLDAGGYDAVLVLTSGPTPAWQLTRSAAGSPYCARSLSHTRAPKRPNWLSWMTIRPGPG